MLIFAKCQRKYCAMFATDDILKKLRLYKADKASMYGIETLGLFGSVARGEQKSGSDLDICIRLKRPDFFNMTAIQEDLEDMFQCKVDVVSLGALMRPLFRKNLERDAIFV